MKPIQVLMLIMCANMSFGVKLDDDNDDLPVVSAKTVFEYVDYLLLSPSESLKEVAKDTLQSFKSQMDDRSKQYAKLTLNGIRFAVNMGASGSALRAENEAILSKLWNFVVSIFYNILSWFGFGNHHTDKSKADKAYATVKNSKLRRKSIENLERTGKSPGITQSLNALDDYYVEDAIFMKIALQQQLCEIEEILHSKHAISKFVKENSINISEDVWTKIKKDNFVELEYRNELTQSINLLEEEIELVNKQVEADMAKHSEM